MWQCSVPGLIVIGDFEDPDAVLPRSSGFGSTWSIRQSIPELPAYRRTRYLQFNMPVVASPGYCSNLLLFPHIVGVQGKTYRVSTTVRSQIGVLNPHCYIYFAFGVNIVTVSYLTGGNDWEEMSSNFRWSWGTNSTYSGYVSRLSWKQAVLFWSRQRTGFGSC